MPATGLVLADDGGAGDVVLVTGGVVGAEEDTVVLEDGELDADPVPEVAGLSAPPQPLTNTATAAPTAIPAIAR